MESSASDIRAYFVDEAGDPVLFGKRGKVLVGTEGCSTYFMLGVAHIRDPDGVRRDLSNLRKELVSDPYFRGVPSMDPRQNKTARCFHAKDDPPEVRREVFRLLQSVEGSVQVTVRRKSCLLDSVKQRNATDPGYRYSEREIYDLCVAWTFRKMLHKADENQIVFAKRGKWTRMEALEAAIRQAKDDYERVTGLAMTTPTTIHSAFPHEEVGLQVIDYYLWALQRLYERGEDRYFNFLSDKYRFIVDVDDTRNRGYGEYYGRKNVLCLQKIKDSLTG